MTVLNLTRSMNDKPVAVILENVNFFEFSSSRTTIHFINDSNIDVYESESVINKMINHSSTTKNIS